MQTAEETIKEYQKSRGFFIDLVNDPNQTTLIGEKNTIITTDRGSLNAKLTSLNPNIAAVAIDNGHAKEHAVMQTIHPIGLIMQNITIQAINMCVTVIKDILHTNIVPSTIARQVTHATITADTTEIIRAVVSKTPMHRKQHSPSSNATHTPTIGMDNNPNSGQIRVIKHRSIIHGVYIAINIAIIHIPAYAIMEQITEQHPTREINTHAMHDGGMIIKTKVIPTITDSPTIKQNIPQTKGTPMANNKNIIAATTIADSTKTAIEDVNPIMMHNKQHPSPINMNTHVPARGIENTANKGQIIVVRHRSNTHSVYATNNTATIHTTM